MKRNAVYRSAQRALGLERKQELPRCHHKVKRRVTQFESKGDFSHSSPKHWCEECTCQRVAGSGTDHYGVGWCKVHELCHPNKDCEAQVRLMTEAIRAGYPDSVWEYKTKNEVMKRIQQQAEESQEVISMRENQAMLIGMFQQVLTAWETGKKANGEMFTESGRDGPREASDATMIEILGKLTDRQAKLAKIELEIQDDNYVSWDEYTRVLYNLSKLVESKVEAEVWDEILEGFKKIPQPMRGRKK